MLSQHEESISSRGLYHPLFQSQVRLLNMQGRDLAAMRIRYSISYLLSSIAHFTNLPDGLGPCKMERSG